MKLKAPQTHQRLAVDTTLARDQTSGVLELNASSRESSLDSGGQSMIHRALERSLVKLAVIELSSLGLRLRSCTPAWAQLFVVNPEDLQDELLDEIRPLRSDLRELLRSSAHEALALGAATSFYHLDSSTQPPRRLAISLSPLESTDSDARLLSCHIEDHDISSDAAAHVAQGAGEAAVHSSHVVDSVPALIWTTGPDGERCFMNESALRFTGLKESQVAAAGWTRCLHPDDAEAYLDDYWSAFHARESFQAEVRVRRHDGVFRSMLDAGRPRYRSDGEFLGFAGSSTDITELRRSETRMRHSERWHRELIENTDNLILQIDHEGLVIFVNPVSRSILGAEPEECVGFPFLDFVHSEDRPQAARRFAHWLENNSAQAHFEHRLISRTGESHDILWTVNSHDSGDGSPSILSCIGQDITERKRAERVHRIQSQVLESMIEGVTLANAAGFILYTNPAHDDMFGYAPGELIGQHLSVLGSQLAADQPQHQGHQLFGLESNYTGEVVHRKKSGEEFHTVVRVKEIEIDGCSHWISVIEDITERKRDEIERQRLDQRIQQVQKLESLGVLAGGIAHDFNNLLMVILGNASLVLQDLDPASANRADVGQIESAALRASELTKKMLAYSGKGQFLIEHEELTAVVEEMRHLLETSMAKNVVVDFELAYPSPSVLCDVTQIRQLLINLVTNASESIAADAAGRSDGHKSGRIVVRTGTKICNRQHLEDTFLADDLPEGVYATFEVEDSGGGMDAETLSKIFDPFFTTKFTGRGLGLAAVLGIVRGHRGAIRVRSTVGQGSVFTVLLPTSQPDQDASLQQPSTSRLAGEGTVLVVDDDDDVRDMASRMLTRLGFQVLEADGGESALALYRRHGEEICVVLLDMTMPTMDGEETFRRLSDLDPDVQVVLSTGYSEQIANERFVDQRLAGFLQKPYRQVDLILKLDQVLNLRS